MACEAKFDKMTPFMSSKGEKEREQFLKMMAKKFEADPRDIAANLRTLGKSSTFNTLLKYHITNKDHSKGLGGDHRIPALDGWNVGYRRLRG